MTFDELDIPDFLRRRPDDPPAPRIEVKRSKKERRRSFNLPKTIEPEGLRLLKQLEREKAEKAKARLAALRELRKK